MVGKDLEVGDLVWAHMKSYPPWPSKIAEPPSDAKSPAKKPHHWVYFFGSKNHAWIPDEKIFPHNEEMLQKALKNKLTSLHKAIDEMLSESKEVPPEPAVQEEIPTNSTETPVKSSEKKSFKMKKSIFKKKTSLDKDQEDTGTKRPSIEAEDADPDAPPKKRFALIKKVVKKKKVLPPMDDQWLKNFPKQPTGIIASRRYVTRPPTPPIDIKTVRESLRKKRITPTNKKIGFLGLGSLGRGMVKNLLNSGHDVTVWNRTPGKCDMFVAAGARKVQTPADVIQSCDITFCCVSDPMATKTLVFGNCGVLKGLEGCQVGSKGYVELTGIDPETSEEISKEIINKGGRYLEAPILGSRTLAEEGQLLVLASGDHSLFLACESSFSAIAKHAYFVSLDIGNACKMSVILSMFNGAVTGALAEALTMVHRCNLSMGNFMDIIEVGSAGCQIVKEKGRAMMEDDFTTNTAVKHQQKDLALALTLGDSVSQPLKITAAAHEVYKRAKRLGYFDHDVSAVIQGTRY